MIKSEEEALRQGIDFFNHRDLPKFAKMVEEGVCLDELFPKIVRSLGKKRVLMLYRKLREELKAYFLNYFRTGSRKFNRQLHKIDLEYKRWNNPISNPKYLREIDRLLVKYLENR
ncbi:hypothetical protein ES703_08204 [subsurface metagenome]